ncbi:MULTISPECIES: hypothetical protein [Streptomyces]|uniref:Lipoprotein n=1 Tax=Streptomyces glycanivorans TaxID=3033808 RepID=A0ABY9JG59_9ACTN|nr:MULTISPECIES: hypothetical protein [unclassified Streptomyces]TXS17305.1 hypothetical protein EAO68_05695 [Streptomyces sp. wa22]WLQ65666.1 hypothetical protein P8A20_19640 [Streptomyces sp. Alt3]WSQ86451.1 hypothetical protein OG722_19735 [Streptomyces sp. NBC_01212]WSR07501.1 hypothetical protein OG265_16505 [Streptomyces sp. NBC_01208]WSR49745.1 hypothetical protein OG279_19860 [Streptomyces sp. NBC_01201]
MDRLLRSGALAATGLVAVLALSACGGDGPAAKKAPATDAASLPASPSGTGRGTDGEDGTAGGAAAEALKGTWTGSTDGLPVALSVTSGRVALSAGVHICQGEVKDMGSVMLALKCLDGNTDRTMGSVESNDGRKIVVSWEAGAEDILTLTDPSDLPTVRPEPSAS